MIEKKTYGQQLLEKIEKNKGDKFAETREVTNEWGKCHLKDLEEIIKNPKYKNYKTLWILILGKKTVVNENIVNVVYGITPRKPKMALHTVLYSYERARNLLRLHWCLPQSIQIAKGVAVSADGFDPLYVESCKEYLRKNFIV